LAFAATWTGRSKSVYEALRDYQPIIHRNILAFLPAKAGGGCSTVALNTVGMALFGTF
jgi:hypothetical protein